MEQPTAKEFDIDEIGSYLAETKVSFAVLFGSSARRTAEESSDVNVALRFPEEMDSYERFRCRDRIETTLREYTDRFVDVSDIDSLPIPTAYVMFRDGTILTGYVSEVKSYRAQVEREFIATKDERERARREFIHKLASGEDAEQARREYQQARQRNQ